MIVCLYVGQASNFFVVLKSVFQVGLANTQIPNFLEAVGSKCSKAGSSESIGQPFALASQTYPLP